MALRGGCSRIGRFVRLAAAALISASALSIAGAPAQAHHYRHRTTRTRYAHYAHHPRIIAHRTTHRAYTSAT